MKIFKFRFPGFRKEDIENLPMTYHGMPIGQILDVEETSDGLIVTGQLSEEASKDPLIQHMFFDTKSLNAFSLGPFPASHDMQDYAKMDARLTKAMFPVIRLPREEDPLSPARGCIIGIGLSLLFILISLLVWLVLLR